MTEKELLELKVGETLGETCREVLRVPGGWIFYNWDFSTEMPKDIGTFVPLPPASSNTEYMQLCKTCVYKDACESVGKQCCDYKKA